MNHLELLRKLVGFRTVNNPVKGVRPTKDCAEYIRGMLLKIGWDARLLESSGVFSVIGMLGKDEPTTLFLSHIDTVPAGEGWETDPFNLTVKGARGYGRGAIDDKANIAALLIAAKELAMKQEDLKGRIVFGFTGDEEIGGVHGAGKIRALIDKEGWKLKNLIIADGVGFNIIIRRRNTAAVNITVKQKSIEICGFKHKRRFETEFFDRSTSHTAYFSPGVDQHALLMMSHFMRRYPNYIATKLVGSFIKGNVVPNWAELEYIKPHKEGTQLKGDLGLTALIQSLYPISRIHFPTLYSDYGINMLPNRFWHDQDIWNVYFDLRAMSVDKEAIRRSIIDALDENLRDYSLKIRTGRAYINTPKDAEIVKIARECSKTVGLNPRLVELGGATDSRFFADLPIGIFDFGPLGGNVHGPNEYVELDSIPKAVRFYYVLASKLHGK